jgi:branched-chain amino acid transport system substrate-binding protein
MGSTRRQVLLGGAAAAVALRTARADDAPTIKMGHIIDTSGPLKSVAEPSVVAGDMALEEINSKGGINGRKLALVRYDAGSDPRQAAIGARKMIEDDKVLGIIGPFSSGEVSVAMNDAERLQCTMIPVAASTPGLIVGKKFLFRMTPDEEVALRNVLVSLQRKNMMPKTAVVMFISDEAVSNNAGNKMYPALLKQFGIQVQDQVGFLYKSFDFAPPVEKALGSKPDVIALASLPGPAASCIHELRRQGYHGPVIGSQLFADPNNRELFGKDGDEVMFATSFWKGSSPQAEAFDAEFVKRCTAKGIHKLGAFHTDAITWDTMHLLASAMETAKVTGDPDKVADERLAVNAAMANIKQFDGLVGKGICFKGNEGQIPGYTIEMMNSDWELMYAFPANACA